MFWENPGQGECRDGTAARQHGGMSLIALSLLLGSLGAAAEAVAPAVAPAPAASAARSWVRPPRGPQGPQPRMPPEALRAGHQGSVLVRFQVMEDGRPGEAEVLSSSRSPLLDRAALRGLRQLRFQPAQNAAGEPVMATAQLRMDFLEWPEPGHRCDALGRQVSWTREAWAELPKEQWRLLAPHLQFVLAPGETLPATEPERAALLERAARVAAACAATPARAFAEVWRETP